MKTHQAIDRRSLEMARRIVAKIDADPRREGLAHARRVCARWVERGNVPVREWMEILEGRGRRSAAFCSRIRRSRSACGRAPPSAESSLPWSDGKFIGRRRDVKRDELEHVLRAAGAITGVSTWVIVGSQAILGAVAEEPRPCLRDGASGPSPFTAR